MSAAEGDSVPVPLGMEGGQYVLEGTATTQYEVVDMDQALPEHTYQHFGEVQTERADPATLYPNLSAVGCEEKEEPEFRVSVLSEGQASIPITMPATLPTSGPVSTVSEEGTILVQDESGQQYYVVLPSTQGGAHTTLGEDVIVIQQMDMAAGGESLQLQASAADLQPETVDAEASLLPMQMPLSAGNVPSPNSACIPVSIPVSVSASTSTTIPVSIAASASTQLLHQSELRRTLTLLSSQQRQQFLSPHKTIASSQPPPLVLQQQQLQQQQPAQSKGIVQTLHSGSPSRLTLQTVQSQQAIGSPPPLVGLAPSPSPRQKSVGQKKRISVQEYLDRNNIQMLQQQFLIPSPQQHLQGQLVQGQVIQEPGHSSSIPNLPWQANQAVLPLSSPSSSPSRHSLCRSSPNQGLPRPKRPARKKRGNSALLHTPLTLTQQGSVNQTPQIVLIIQDKHKSSFNLQALSMDADAGGRDGGCNFIASTDISTTNTASIISTTSSVPNATDTSASVTEAALENGTGGREEQSLPLHTSCDAPSDQGDTACGTSCQAADTSSINTAISVLPKPPPQPKEQPQLIEGKLAVCPFCGFLSGFFNRCQRCNRKLPNDVKAVEVQDERLTYCVGGGSRSSRGLTLSQASSSSSSISSQRISKERFYSKGEKSPIHVHIHDMKKVPADHHKMPSQRSTVRSRPKKFLEEPECLTISSDEEAETNTPGAHGHNSKEPVIAEDYEEQERLQGPAIEGGGAGGGGSNVPCNLDIKGLAEGNYSMLKCRSVRIGSYKTAPSERVLFTQKGIQLVVPGIRKPETVSIVILREEMLRVLTHFGRSLPVVFVYVTPRCAQRVARQLQMNPCQEPYFSPISSNETHKRITFLPDYIREEEKITLRNVLGGEADGVELLGELDQGEANEILVRSSPREAQKTMQRSSSRPHGSSGFTVTAISSSSSTTSPLPSPSPSPTASPAATTASSVTTHSSSFQLSASASTSSSVMETQSRSSSQLTCSEVHTILVWPPPPAKGGIPINTEDYCCLEEEQFLNDVIIDFYLKYLLQCRLSEQDRMRTHVFSSFFYKRLTTRPPRPSRRSNPVEDDPRLSAAEKRHARVKSWTKNVDLFEKDFVIIPINEHAHWFLAIICFPGLSGCVRMRDNQPVASPYFHGARRQPLTSTTASQEDSSVNGSQSNSSQVTGSSSSTPTSTPPAIPITNQSMRIGTITITPVPSSRDLLGTSNDTSVNNSPNSAASSQVLLGDDLSDRDEAEGDDDEMEANSNDADLEESKSSSQTKSQDNVSVAETPPINSPSPQSPVQSTPSFPPIPISTPTPTPTQKPPPMMLPTPVLSYCGREPIKQPCILIFDSLAGASRSRVVATLRDYLRIEHRVRKGLERDFSKDIMKGANPKVPQQSNFSDCGVYVLQYAESFFQKPLTDYSLPVRTLANWFPEEVARGKRRQIQQLIKALVKEQNPDHPPLPKLRFGSDSVSEAGEDDEDNEEVTVRGKESTGIDSAPSITSTPTLTSAPVPTPDITSVSNPATAPVTTPTPPPAPDPVPESTPDPAPAAIPAPTADSASALQMDWQEETENSEKVHVEKKKGEQRDKRNLNLRKRESSSPSIAVGKGSKRACQKPKAAQS